MSFSGQETVDTYNDLASVSCSNFNGCVIGVLFIISVNTSKVLGLMFK